MHPLAEVFGFPTTSLSADADRYRRNRLCPFNNRVPNCTKDKAENPLGVCSIFDGDDVVITCPVRFRQEWLIAEDAAGFFFSKGTSWTSLTEVRLNDKNGRSAGNIDAVLVSYDDRTHQINSFGALEVQAVYISGNVRRPFEYYMSNPHAGAQMNWTGQSGYPRPDYLSSSRKRLAPQLLFKGGILKAWNRRMAVALNKGFFDMVPDLKPVGATEADIAWLIYDLRLDSAQNRYVLDRYKTVYTRFEEALTQITQPEVGEESAFIKSLQTKLDEKMDDGNAPETNTIDFRV